MKFAHLTITVACLIGLLFSCGENLSPSPSMNTSLAKSTELFDQIRIKENAKGEISFAEERSVTLARLEQVFVHNNKLLAHVDDFGIARDESGASYLYVKEFSEERVETAFFYIKNIKDVLENNGTKIVGGKCVNENCCDECVVNNSSCVCHDQNSDCQANGETNFSCTREDASVVVTPPASKSSASTAG